MRRINRLRSIALLMCSIAVTVIVLLAGNTPVAASNCCQDCDEMESACANLCNQECEGDEYCLNLCYEDCRVLSDNCWGRQGYGRYCTWCTYGCNNGFNCYGEKTSYYGGYTFKPLWCWHWDAGCGGY